MNKIKISNKGFSENILLGYNRKIVLKIDKFNRDYSNNLDEQKCLSATIHVNGFYSWSSCKGRKGNALALRADEGRDKLR